MNRYMELKNKHRNEFNSFPMFFAFNQQQFDAGMRKLGLNSADTGKICMIGGTGGYIRLEDREAFLEMDRRTEKELSDAIAADETGMGFIYDMFLHELRNHEYGYTYNDTDTLAALGYTVKDINDDPRLSAGLVAAKKKIIEEDYE